eukprot:COSAG01_NODE_95_length_26957_cov_48.328617_5_plen_120_part_00
MGQPRHMARGLGPHILRKGVGERRGRWLPPPLAAAEAEGRRGVRSVEASSVQKAPADHRGPRFHTVPYPATSLASLREGRAASVAESTGALSTRCGCLGAGGAGAAGGGAAPPAGGGAF